MARTSVESVETLPAFWDRIWQVLTHAVGTARHPFHTPAVATLEGNQPRVRVVVLRHADSAHLTLRFHTDARTPKVAQMQAGSRVELCFYSPDDRLQVRCAGIARVHHNDEVAEEKWQASALLSRRCYTTPYAPGDLSATPTSGLPADLEGREPTEEEANPGYAAFCVVEVAIQEIDALLLAFTGHRRAKWSAVDEWKGTWLIP